MELGDTSEDAPKDPRRAGARLRTHIAVAFESDRPLAGGLRLELDGVDRVLVGRGPERRCERRLEGGRSTVVLQAPGKAMSGMHAQLLREGTAWTAYDLQSTNGTFVNGRAISVHHLRPRDVLEMGHTLFVFSGEVATPEGTAPVAELPASTASPAVATLVPSFERELASLARWAATPLPVLVLGETGTGKELVARSLHALSGRSGAWVAVNCAALPASLVESQLFGHCRGAFSGAVRDEPGLVRSAEGGTLLLDEIGDLPLAAQGALLRVLQEGEVVPVGTTRALKVDVRVVAATHRDLRAMVAGGAFRADLLARLDGATVRLPALRDRRADIGILVGALLRRVAGARAERLRFDPQAALALTLQRGRPTCASWNNVWPGRWRRRMTSSAWSTFRRRWRPRWNGAPRWSRTQTARRLSSGRARPAPANAPRERGGRRARIPEGASADHRWMKRFGLDPKVYRHRLATPERG